MSTSDWDDLDTLQHWDGQPLFVLVTQDGFDKTLWGPFDSLKDANDWARGITVRDGVEISTDVLWAIAKPVRR